MNRQAGSPSAEELLADDRWLRGFALRLVRDPDAADELTQDAWVRALESAPPGIDRRGLRAWLARVTRNLLARRHRDADLRRFHERGRPGRAETREASAELERLQLQHRVAGALLALEEPCRSAVVLRYREELPYDEVAARLGVDPVTARKRVSRGLAVLRARLAREHGDAGARVGPGWPRWAPWTVAGLGLLAAGAWIHGTLGAGVAGGADWSARWPGAGDAPARSARLAPWVGRWEPPAGRTGEGLELAWSATGASLSVRQHLVGPDGESPLSDGLLGWHPGQGQLVFLEFFRDRESFESVAEGAAWIEEGGALGRELLVVEPDRTSRAYRDRLVPRDGGWSREVDYEDDRGTWRRLGDFPVERTENDEERDMRTNRLAGPSAALAALGALAPLAAAAALPAQAPAHESPRRTTDDQEAMRHFEFYIGRWCPPGEAPEFAMEFAWGFEEKTVHVREYRREGNGFVALSESLAGWHYGEQRVVFLSFARDGVHPFEVMNTGHYRFEEGDVLVRELESFDPDGTSRRYRERFVPDGPEAWDHHIEYEDDDGTWKPWNVFRGERQP